MMRIKTAVIGAGYLGKFHIEKLASLPHSNLAAICDIDKNQLHVLSKRHNIITTSDYQSLVGKIDAVNVVTPTASHFDIAQFFLKNGVHVFIEKPISTKLEDANHLIQLAKKNNLILQVGHIERFNPAFQAMKTHLSNPFFIEAQRLKPFQVRGSDASVILDLMIHDIDLVLSITNAKIKNITATGTRVVTSWIDIANARITFDNNCVASITASRINTHTIRQLRVFQHNAYLYTDMDKNNCYIRERNSFEEKCLPKNDALNDEINAFLHAIIYHKTPIVSGQQARNALAVAIHIEKLCGEYAYA